jgi:hypothetical protein
VDLLGKTHPLIKKFFKILLHLILPIVKSYYFIIEAFSSPLMGEAQGGGKVIGRLYCIIPPPPNPLPPGEEEFKAMEL